MKTLVLMHSNYSSSHDSSKCTASQINHKLIGLEKRFASYYNKEDKIFSDYKFFMWSHNRNCFVSFKMFSRYLVFTQVSNINSNSFYAFSENSLISLFFDSRTILFLLFCWVCGLKFYNNRIERPLKICNLEVMPHLLFVKVRQT
jgi:hypothetical protein